MQRSTTFSAGILLMIGAVVGLTDCGGGGSSGPASAGAVQPPIFTPTPVPQSTPTPLPPLASSSVVVSPTNPVSTSLGPILGGYGVSVVFPQASNTSTFALSFSTSQPGGTPSVQQVRRRPQNIGAQGIGPIAFLTIQPVQGVSFGLTPAFTFSLPFSAANLGPLTYVAMYDPSQPQIGWTTIGGPGGGSGTILSVPSSQTPITLRGGLTYAFVVFSSVSAVPSPTPSPSPTPQQTASPSPTPTPSLTPTPVPGPGQALNGPLSGPLVKGAATWTPTSLARALDFPVQHGWDGSGFTIAIFSESGVFQNDLDAYAAFNSTPLTGRTILERAVDNATTAPVGGKAQSEATLDAQTIAGLAPGANILLYVAFPDGITNIQIADAYNRIISDKTATIASISFSACETPGITAQSGQSAIFEQAASQGVTFVASTGDQGNDCFTGYDAFGNPLFKPGVGYPASDPNVIGVGGTQSLPPQFSLLSTTAWNDSNGATGGGVSGIFPLPTYQQGIAGLASPNNRNVPDLAMPAEWSFEINSGAPSASTGTSWSAPQFAALLAETFEYCRGAFKDPAPIPYIVFRQSGYSAFLDVTANNNDFDPSGPYFAAKQGYDNVTGIGVPFGMAFTQSLCPNRSFSASARAMAVATQSIHRRPAIAVRANVEAHLTGLVDLGSRAGNEPVQIQIVLLPTTEIAADELTAINVLQSAGFTITKRFANHLVVDARGPSSAAEALFGTTIHNVREGAYGNRYTPVSPGTLPTSLAPYVAGLTLDNLVTAIGRHDRRR